MKRILSLLLLACLALGLLAGCQATPDTPVVVQKDQEQMLQTAQQGRDNSALLAALEVPERFTGDWTGVNGFVHVTADAEIILPNADKIPTGSIGRRDFTQTDLDNFLRVFMKGQPFYEEVYLTRQEAMAQLEYYQAMQRGEIPLAGDATYAKLPDVIAYYAEQARTAPDEGELRLASTSFVSDGPLENMSGWSEVDGKKVHLWVQNFPDVWDSAVFYVQDYGDPNYDNSQPSSAVPDGIPKEPFQPDFSAEEAQQMADALIAELGFENVVCDKITPVFFADAMTLHGAIPEPDGASPEISYSQRWNDPEHFVLDTGYQLQYVRCVEGFPIAYTTHRGDYVEHESYNKVWVYEQIQVDVTKDGVVYFSWISPSTEPVLELADTQLMSFDEISSIFERMFMVKYSYIQTINDNGGDSHPHMRIDTVRLSLMRIRAKDDTDRGLLIPVWDFCGTYVVPGEPSIPQEPEIFLTLNAIDGSMVDRDLGY